MRPVEFGEALAAGTWLTLFSDDKPDRFFTVIRFWMDESLGVPLALSGGVPSYQVEDEEGRTHLLIHLPIKQKNEDRWCLWRPDQAGFDSRSIFDGALLEGISDLYSSLLNLGNRQRTLLVKSAISWPAELQLLPVDAAIY